MELPSHELGTQIRERMCREAFCENVAKLFGGSDFFQLNVPGSNLFTEPMSEGTSTNIVFVNFDMHFGYFIDWEIDCASELHNLVKEREEIFA
eukprot:scaffold53391_cov95-Cyclotella_meneghiniana.AAC.2